MPFYVKVLWSKDCVIWQILDRSWVFRGILWVLAITVNTGECAVIKLDNLIDGGCVFVLNGNGQPHCCSGKVFWMASFDFLFKLVRSLFLVWLHLLVHMTLWHYVIVLAVSGGAHV